MAYIPEKHKKYGLLPRSVDREWEIFSYSSELLSDINKLLPKGEGLTPYGYKSCDEYCNEIDRYMQEYAETEEQKCLFMKYKADIRERNIKEDWSVLRYVGETTDDLFGLTHGQTYYWPASAAKPEYEGVIDDEEWTSYCYSTAADDWEILEDPTGMARATIYRNGKGHMSREEYENIIDQLRNMNISDITDIRSF